MDTQYKKTYGLTFKYLKYDLPASMVVFLVALPLCLGVALASGAPLLSGIISGIIGGIVVGVISGSHTSVSGPAAGLAAVVFSAIAQLGNYETFLLAVVLAGIIQFICGIAKAGFIANYIPSNVIKGLLAAIGIILILKQIPHIVGYDRDPEDDFSFFQKDGENTLSELLYIFNYFSWGAVIVSTISIAIFIYWDKSFLRKLKFLPASLFIVILGVIINIIFENFFPELYIEKQHLVNIPEITHISSLVTQPSFADIGNYEVWLVAFTIAIIASLETLLNLEAVQNIDPHKRHASPNRELIAQGVGNIIVGFLGGIPITSVIVRSSVNINVGAKTKLSTILHGGLLLVSILFLSSTLNLIPLASLATILLMTGYKLAKASLFIKMYKKGANQFIPFMVTIIAIVFTDLLVGILIGLATSIFYLLKSNFKNPFTIEREKLNLGETVRIEFPNQVSFFNKASIKETLWALPRNTKVVIDATHSDYIDNDVLSVIDDFKNTVSIEKNIQLNIIGLKDTYNMNDVIQFTNFLDKETQQKLKPAEILEILKLGNDRFMQGKFREKYLRQQVNATSSEQHPMAVIVCCIDSRTSPELIFDVGLGDIISIRIAGNIVNDEIIGSIELACQEIGTKLIVVLGHSNCGAVSSAINLVNQGHISFITNKIEKAIAQCNCDRDKIIADKAMFDKVIQNNVTNSLDEILKESEYLNKAIISQQLSIVSAFYDTTSGLVSFEEKV